MIKFAKLLNSDKIIHIKDTTNNETYYCNECNNILIPKKGKIKVHHFCHKFMSNCSGGSIESLEHKYAKQFMSDNLNNIVIIKNCKICNKNNEHNYKNHRIKQEYRIGRYTVDLVILNNDNLIAVIEIFHTHQTEWNKKRMIELYPLEFIEIRTFDLISANKVDEIITINVQEDYCKECFNKCLFKFSQSKNIDIHYINHPYFGNKYDKVAFCETFLFESISSSDMIINDNILFYLVNYIHY